MHKSAFFRGFLLAAAVTVLAGIALLWQRGVLEGMPASDYPLAIVPLLVLGILVGGIVGLVCWLAARRRRR